MPACGGKRAPPCRLRWRRGGGSDQWLVSGTDRILNSSTRHLAFLIVHDDELADIRY